MNLVYFTDRDLGNRFPDTLTAAGLRVERHHDHFSPDCPDDEWLAAIGSKGWVAITRDQRIRYKPNELAAVIRHRVRLLVVIGKASFAELARNFVVTEPKIAALLATQSPPMIAKIYRPTPSELAANAAASGHVTRWYP